MNCLTLKKATDYVNDYVVLDFETTGLNASFDKIIEVSILKYKNNELIDEFVTLVNPEIPINPFITSITGITNSMVESFPTISQILPLMINFIDKNVIVGHNVNFDLRFLKYAIEYYGITTKNTELMYIDTLFLSRRFLNDLPNHKLETLKNYYKIEEISHRAKQDCLVTNIIFQNIKNGIKQ